MTEKKLLYFPRDFKGKCTIPDGVEELELTNEDYFFDDGELFYGTDTYSPFTRLSERTKQSAYDSMLERGPIVNCPYLTCLEFPESFTNLPKRSLRRCLAFKTVIFHAKNRIQIQNRFLYIEDNCMIYRLFLLSVYGGYKWPCFKSCTASFLPVPLMTPTMPLLTRITATKGCFFELKRRGVL